MKTRPNFSTLVIILIIIAIGYWQVLFFLYGLKWDLIDVVFPFRYYFSECINSGYFPFWNPYQQVGSPFYADLQAPTYYPELLIISLLGRYSIYTMHVLFGIYLIIAAIGMYKLSFYFNQSRNASLLASLAYVFSGYVVGHGQHFFLLVGAAWIPFVLLSYIKLNQDKKIIDCLKTGVFVFLLITGAYQALSIAMLYLLLLIFAYFFLLAVLIEKDLKKTWQILKLNFIFSVFVVVLTLPLIISTLETLSLVERLDSGVSLAKTLAFSQPLSALMSFIVPFSTVKYNEFFGNTDSSLINHYIGIIPFIFLMVSIFKRHSILEYIILGFGLIIFSMSFDFLPVRKVLYQYLPLMDLFLSAAYLRIYGLLAFILISAKYFSFFEKNISSEKNKILIAGLTILVALVSLLIISINKLTFHDFKTLFEHKYVIEIFENTSFYQNIFIQALFHTFLVGALLFTILYNSRIKFPITVILILVAVELVFAAQLNMNKTVIDMRSKPQDMQKNLSLSPEGFPIPVNSKIIFNDQQHAFFEPFWRNSYIFTKQVAFDAFSSFKLSSYRKLETDYPNLKSATLNNHLVYFSDIIIPLTTLNDDEISLENSNYLFVSKRDYAILSKVKVKTDKTDIIKITKFSPKSVEIETKTTNDQFLTLLQTNFKGWKAFVDDKEIPIYTSNFNYRTILLAKGKHKVKFEFNNKKIVVFYIISNLVFFCCVLLLLGRWLYVKRKGGKTYIYLPLLLFLLILFLLIFSLSKKQTYNNVNGYYHATYPPQNAYISKIQDFESIATHFDTTFVFSGKKSLIVDSTMEFIPLLDLVQNKNRIKEGTLKVSFKLYSDNYCKALIASEVKNKWHANKIEKQIEGLNQWNSINYLRPIPEMAEGEVLKIYLWNLNKAKFIIDDVSVELFK